MMSAAYRRWNAWLGYLQYMQHACSEWIHDQIPTDNTHAWVFGKSNWLQQTMAIITFLSPVSLAFSIFISNTEFWYKITQNVIYMYLFLLFTLWIYSICYVTLACTVGYIQYSTELLIESLPASSLFKALLYVCNSNVRYSGKMLPWQLNKEPGCASEGTEWQI